MPKLEKEFGAETKNQLVVNDKLVAIEQCLLFE